MKRLAIWCAGICLKWCGIFYRYGLDVPEVVLTVARSTEELELLVQDVPHRGDRPVWH